MIVQRAPRGGDAVDGSITARKTVEGERARVDRAVGVDAQIGTPGMASWPVPARVVDGRKYVAFIVPNPLGLLRLTWLDAAGRVIASTTALPQYGYVQFQP